MTCGVQYSVTTVDLRRLNQLAFRLGRLPVSRQRASANVLVKYSNRTPEPRTLNPRVRGSSPWRRTRTDLGFYHSRSFFWARFVLVKPAQSKAGQLNREGVRHAAAILPVAWQAGCVIGAAAELLAECAGRATTGWTQITQPRRARQQPLLS